MVLLSFSNLARRFSFFFKSDFWIGFWLDFWIDLWIDFWIDLWIDCVLVVFYPLRRLFENIAINYQFYYSRVVVETFFRNTPFRDGSDRTVPYTPVISYPFQHLF